jgi:acyl-homoserine lactone acylase PvdQ
VWCALGALAFAGLIALAGVTSVRLTLPQISGTVRVPSLHGQVTVVRDKWGVPHVYARDEHDLYVAQGYVTAQDRLWQMLLRRQAARGQVSAWLGPRASPADNAQGYQDWPAQAAADVSLLDDQTRAMFEAYALGVNACLATCSDPPELTLLKRQGKVRKIEPWTVADSLGLGKLIKWAQASQSPAHLLFDLQNRVGRERTTALLLEGTDLPAGPHALVDPAMHQALRLSGLPLMGGDVALLPGLPSAWYVMVLHSDRITNVGGTWPGMPGVMTTTGIDVATSMAAYSAASQRSLVEHLLALRPTGWLQVRVHGMLRQWDYDLSGRTRLGNASAAVYQAWLWRLARDTFQDDLGEDLFARYWATGLAPEALARLVEEPDNAWWNDVETPQHETRDDILRRAYAEALDDLGRHYGDLHTIWEWDTMHAATFRHPLGDSWPMSWLLNRTIELGGDAPFDPAHSEDPLNPYAPVLVSPLRINRQADGDLQIALAGGQSGNPFSPHYADLLSAWARGELTPLQHTARPQDLRNAEGTLVLVP